jgi:hypothetical protein
MPDGRFGTALTCIDGRVHDALVRWLKAKYLLDYVDLVTEPGVDRVLASGPLETIEHLRGKVQLSLERHASSVIAVAAHFDCASNPGTREEHLAQLRRAAEAIRAWGLAATVEVLWLDDRWEVEAL